MFEVLSDFLSDLSLINTIPELEARIEPTLKHYHIEHFICTNMYGLEGMNDLKPMFGLWNTPWVEHYVRNSYYNEDAIVTYQKGLDGNGIPYYWTDLVASKELSKAQYHMFAEAWEVAKLKEGLVVPLVISEEPPEELALVSMAGEHFTQDPTLRGILHSISIQSHRRARQILLREHHAGKKPQNRVIWDAVVNLDKLTNAEITIIRYLADGKTVSDIANLSGRSPKTIGNQIRSASKKVGALTTTHLVILAKRHGVIT